MGLKTIIIDNQTTLKEENGQTKLDLVVYPLDEENNLEPYQQLSVYVNNELLGTLTSDIDGEAKASLQLHTKPSEEGIKLRISDEVSGVQSKIKYILLNNQSGAQEDNQINESVREEEKRKYIAQVKINYDIISDLPDRAKADKEIVKYALEQDGCSLRFISDNLRNDKEIVKIALKNTTSAMDHVSEILSTDEVFILKCLSEFGIGIWYCLHNYIKKQPKIKEWKDKHDLLENQMRKDRDAEIKNTKGVGAKKYKAEIYEKWRDKIHNIHKHIK